MKRFVFILTLMLTMTLLLSAEEDSLLIKRYEAERAYYYESGQEYMAVVRQRQLVDLYRKTYGETDKRYLMSLLSLSELYAERLYPGLSNKYHRMAYEPYMFNIKKRFAEIAESEKGVYWSSVADYFSKTVNTVYDQAVKGRFDDGGEMAAAAYNALLLSKGLLLNLNIDFEMFVKSSGDEKSIELLEERKRASAMADSARVDSIDYAILQRLRDVGNPYTVSRLSVTWQDVQEKLGDGDLAIEFFKTTKGDYGALLLGKGWKSPKVVQLKSGKRRDSWSHKTKSVFVVDSVAKDVVRCFSNTKGSTADEGFISSANAMSDIVWCDAVMQYFPYKGKGKVYFAADGMLQLCPIEYLPIYKIGDKDSLYGAIADVFDLRRVSSTRDLVLGRGEERMDSAVVYGGIQYDMKVDEMVAMNKRGADVKARVARNLDYRQIKRSSVPYLAGTKDEAKAIADIMNRNGVNVRMVGAYTASEESFKALEGKGYDVLHIGTHGFYWNDYKCDDALNKCGLFMAGANVVMKGGYKKIPQWMQDGVLTAKEISVMDLRGCDMVILSACETAKGDLSTDGVFGLQRAFKMAGVQTIVMSLWTVSDAATKMLMTEFYTNWMVKGQTKQEAFRNARNAVRTARDESGRRLFESPFFWAGFVLLD